MEAIVTVKSPWPEWIIEKQTGQTNHQTEYLACSSQGREKFFSSIKLISIPRSQDDIDYAIKHGASPEAESLSKYFLSVANSFIDQIKAVQGIGNHENIVRYEDCLLQKNGEMGHTVFLRTERLQPLSEYLSNRSLSDIEIAALGADICSAISVCAANGIVHGDIKPSNIFVSKSGKFKLGNFGVHIFQRSADSQNGATRAYMAPELSAPDAVFSEATDTYSLGLVLYWLLNNRELPFIAQGDTNIYKSIIERRLSGEQIPMPSEGCDVIKAVVMTSVAFNPSNRFRSAEVFRTALLNFLNGSRSRSGNAAESGGIPVVITGQHEAGTDTTFELRFQNTVPPESQSTVFAQSPVNTYNNPLPTQGNFNTGNFVPPEYGQNPLQQYKMTHSNQKSGKNRVAAVVLIVAGVVALLVISLLVTLYFLGFFSGDKSLENEGADISSDSVASSDIVEADPDDEISSEEEIAVSSEEEIPEPDTENVIPVKKVTCSKHAGNGKYKRTYGAEMSVDGNPETCWMAYGTPAGKGNWIKIDFGKKTTVTGIKIINGNTWDGFYNGSFIDGYEELYEKNGRLCEYELEFSDGTKISGKAADENESDFSANIIYFDQPIETTYIKLYVKSGYKGYKYKNNVCIGEIQAFC